METGWRVNVLARREPKYMTHLLGVVNTLIQRSPWNAQT